MSIGGGSPPLAREKPNAGMRPRIVRSSNGKCCPWCSSLAGEYYADEAPDDIYARHDNCTCTVTYISEKGYQDAHTKKWIAQQETEARRSRIDGDRAYIETLRREREAEKTARIKNLSKQRKHPYTTLVSDVNRLYYQTDSPQIRKIPDQAVYIVANLPKSGKHKLIDGSTVFIEGKSLKRILARHGKEFGLKEFKLLRDTIRSPDCIAINTSRHRNSLILYKELKWSNKSVMECVFIREGENVIIHYHKISKRKIRKLQREGRIIENRIQV